MSQFEYRSLTPHQKRIRLVHVLPEFQNGDQGDPDVFDAETLVSCTISHVSLEKAPPYTALSYNWGDATITSSIIVNGSVVSVTKNLELALRHLRLPDQELILWIDALCINQQNNLEKTEQLEQMRPIYSGALSVIAWVGPPTATSDSAMQWIDSYGGQAFKLGIGTRPDLQLRRVLETFETGKEKGAYSDELEAFVLDLQGQFSTKNPKQSILISALTELFNRPYWGRAWVVQELVSASDATFVCGKSKVTESALHHATRLLRNYRQYRLLKHTSDMAGTDSKSPSILSTNTYNPIRLLKFRRSAKLPPLIYLLRSCRDFKATDPRDKVFALLGIAGDAEPQGIVPDYSKLCQDVYTDLARTLIQNGYIELLSLCEFPKNVEGLPSWVPDWSRRVTRGRLQQRSLDRSRPTPFGQVPLTTLQPRFSASGDNGKIQLRIQESIGRDMPLMLSGTFIGEVRKVGRAWEDNGIGSWLSDLHSLAQSIPEASDHAAKRTTAVWRTAVADQDIRHGGSKPRLSDEKIAFINEKLESENLELVDANMLIRLGLGDFCRQLCDRPRLAANSCI